MAGTDTPTNRQAEECVSAYINIVLIRKRKRRLIYENEIIASKNRKNGTKERKIDLYIRKIDG